MEIGANTLHNLSFSPKNFYFAHDKLVIRGIISKPVKLTVQIWLYRKSDKKYLFDNMAAGNVTLEKRNDGRYNFVSEIDLRGKRKRFDAEYYSFSLLFPQGTCVISDLKLEQKISGYIDLAAWSSAQKQAGQVSRTNE